MSTSLPHISALWFIQPKVVQPLTMRIHCTRHIARWFQYCVYNAYILYCVVYVDILYVLQSAIICIHVYGIWCVNMQYMLMCMQIHACAHISACNIQYTCRVYMHLCALLLLGSGQTSETKRLDQVQVKMMLPLAVSTWCVNLLLAPHSILFFIISRMI